MKLVAIVRKPAQLEEAAAVLAAATGLTLAECRTRLSPELPALVARLEGTAADALVSSLRSAGLAALAIDAQVPTDTARTLARQVAFTPDAVTFTPRFGEPMEIAWPDVLAVLRGSRESRADVERTEKSRSLSLGMAVATGGLKVTRTPSSTANMVALDRRLRERASHAFHDDRLLRLGRRPLPFVAPREVRSGSAGVTVTSRDTASSLDVLAEVLHQAVAQALLP